MALQLRPISRRSFLRASAALSLAAFPHLPLVAAATAPHVAVIGAGAFGGWTALALARAGARVTLIDAWGPGNSRSSSGDESRVIRGVYGDDPLYTEWVARSFAIWQAAETSSRAQLYHRTGALWMFAADDGYARRSVPVMKENGLVMEQWSLEDAVKRYPQIDFTGVGNVWYEPEAGYLTARDSCAIVRDLAAGSGANWLLDQISPGTSRNGMMTDARHSDGTLIRADAWVFACGPWLGSLFPEIIGDRVLPTRQEVFYFGTPAGVHSYDEDAFPVWVDFGSTIFYGIPGNRWRGFKVADDTRGTPSDPTTMERTPTPEAMAAAREQLRRRFPLLKDAPLVESRVCQYENSPDGDFIIDRHPEARNVFLVGGGSGHGFKLAPALGEHVASLVLGSSEPLPKFSLERFEADGTRKTQIGRESG
jgi:sarcosine oxidase